jgi:N-acetylmuramoyl-L-alanine amidase cwlD
MFIINKRRVAFILMSVLLPIGIFSYQYSNTNKNAISTMALPVTNKTIVIDAGHGGEDGGATSENGISEAQINLKIALNLQKLLEQSGANVILTRSDENAIYDLDKKTLREKKVSDIKNRVKIGNNSSADIFVSIHLNKIPQNQYSGWQTFYKDGNEQGKELATSIQNNLNETIQKENKRVPMKISNVYIIKQVEIPTAIVECGFLSNPEEEQILQQEIYQEKLAWGIYNGIIEYFN